MKTGKRLKTLVMVAMAMTLTMAAAAQAGQFKVLHEFRGNFDGAGPTDALIQDSNGNLFGTTIGGGLIDGPCAPLGCGTVFELSPNGSGGWTMQTLHRFGRGSDGERPSGALVQDGAGNIFGTTEYGGQVGCGSTCGTVFELSPTSGGWVASTVFSFDGHAGGSSPSGLLRDANGNLYGTTGQGGSGYAAAGFGVAYELSSGSGGVWTETVLHTFSQTDGAGPNSTLYMDSNGNLLGTVVEGGVMTGKCKTFGGCGTVFELSPASGGGWSFSEYSIPAPGKGIWPRGGVREDAAGNLFGVTFYGGQFSSGVVFKLSPATGGGWTESVIHFFDGALGANPEGLIEDGNGGFYGSAAGGANGACNFGCGLVFDLTPGPHGGWVQGILHRFSGFYDGGNPNRLFVDGNGNIFGTTEAGGNTKGGSVCSDGCGVVFEIAAPAPAKR